MPGDYAENDYFEEVGSAAARLLLQRPQLPTAIVAPNDHTAVGVLQVLVRSGVRVPQDVSITGFDDAPIARLSAVDLTTVRQDPGLMGVAAVEAAVRRIENTGLRRPIRSSRPPWSSAGARRHPSRHRSGLSNPFCRSACNSTSGTGGLLVRVQPGEPPTPRLTCDNRSGGVLRCRSRALDISNLAPL